MHDCVSAASIVTRSALGAMHVYEQLLLYCHLTRQNYRRYRSSLSTRSRDKVDSTSSTTM